MMRAIPVYRVDHRRKAKDPIGVIFERRKTERAANYYDLLRLARRLFAANTADADHIVIDVSEVRRAILPERARDCPMGQIQIVRGEDFVYNQRSN